MKYHRVQEAQAAGFINFIHMDGKHNPADILTKFRSSREWYELLKPLIFWRARDDALRSHIVEGSDNRSPSVPVLRRVPESGSGTTVLRRAPESGSGTSEERPPFPSVD